MKGKAKKEAVEEIQTESVEQPVPEDKPEVQEVEHKKDSIFQKEFSSIYLVLLGIILMAAVTFWGVISFGYIQNPLKKENEATSAVQTPQSTPKKSPSTTESSESAKPKKELTIQILNGSGIAGQAGELKLKLADLGYENIEVGNAEDRTNTKTTVTFSKNVSNKDKDGITKELEKTFEKVEVLEQTGKSEFDAVITTGSYL